VKGIFVAFACSIKFALLLTAIGMPDYYFIGNSLTNNTRPGHVPKSEKHVFCGKNLDYILNNPLAHCSGNQSVPWTEALLDPISVVSVQPHFGTTLDEDVNAINTWVAMQSPDTLWMIHSGWNREADLVADFDGGWVPGQKMTHAPDYYDALIGALETNWPDRQFILNPVVYAVRSIAEDIENNRGPYSALSEIYSDTVHFSDNGRWLAHNQTRVMLGLPFSDADLVVDPVEKAYLETKIVVPTPAVACGFLLLLLAAFFGRSRKT